MAIIKTNTGNITVATIAERNALTSKFNGMEILVLDASADTNIGSGSAEYQWVASTSTWELIWSHNRQLPWNKITSKPTTLAGYGITDAMSNNVPTLFLPNGNISSITATTTSTATQVIDTISATLYRSASYKIQITSGTAFHTVDISILHDGTTCYMTAFNELTTSNILATFDAAIVAESVQLTCVPTQATSTVFNAIRTVINI